MALSPERMSYRAKFCDLLECEVVELRKQVRQLEGVVRKGLTIYLTQVSLTQPFPSNRNGIQ